MKHIFLLSIVTATLIGFTGCEEKSQETETTKSETTTMKCDAGKCGSDMGKVEKATTPTNKCTAGGKCGEGKCGGTAKVPANTP